jgi:predicted enzyme related to lactoylglutathione lyase
MRLGEEALDRRLRRGTATFYAGLSSHGPMEKGKVQIGSIVMDVKDFPRMMTFWQEALGYRPARPTDPDDPFMILKDPAGKGPNVSIDGMEPYRNRLHLDLYTDDPDGEVERLLRLGAAVFRPREPDEDFVVLEDPEGNLFCVVDTRSG